MKLSSSSIGRQTPEGEQKCLNSELWHACAGPLVSLPAIGGRVIYFPQGHSEQVAASTNKEVDADIPNYPILPPQLICQLHDVTMHADAETDEVYAQMTLHPLNPQEQKDSYLPPDLVATSKQPTNYFCKILTASDTSTHGGFSVPRRAAENVFPPLDFSLQPPAQELVARDLHDNEWKFRHIFRGQPKRHLLTTGWSVFVSAKRLVAGDSVLFIWNENNELLLGIRRANRPRTVMPSSVLSSDSMHMGLLAAAAHAATTNSRFTVFYDPRASSSEFIVPLSKYAKAVFHTRVSIGMRFRMLFETEECSVRRYMGTITGISDIDPGHWPNSHWRSVKVGWDESIAGARQPRVSLWEIEPLTSFPMYPSPFALSLKRPWSPGLPSLYGLKDDNIGLSSPLWLRDGAERGMDTLNFQGFGFPPWMQPRFDPSVLGLQQDFCQTVAAAAAVQDTRFLDPIKQSAPEMLQFQQSRNCACTSTLVHCDTQPLIQPEAHPNLLHTIEESLVQNHSQHRDLTNLLWRPGNGSIVYQQLEPQQVQPSAQLQQHEGLQLQNEKMQSLCLPGHEQVHNFLSASAQISPQGGILAFQTHPSFVHNIHALPSSSISSFPKVMQTFSPEEASSDANLPTVTSIATANIWSSKRLAVETTTPANAHCASPQTEQLVPPDLKISQHSSAFWPFPRRVCSKGQDCDPETENFIYGAGIDSSSFICQTSTPYLEGTDSDNDSAVLPYPAINFLNSTESNFAAQQGHTDSECVKVLGTVHFSDHVGEVNPQIGTFVNVYKSGCFGRSIDISKFCSYTELRNELGHLFGLEGQLEDPLRSGWQLVFIDRENDPLLVGDDPWQEFVNNVRCIQILSPPEMKQMGKCIVDSVGGGPVVDGGTR